MTTFLLVGALVVELVGGDVPAGMLGVGDGLFAGLVAAVPMTARTGRGLDVALAGSAGACRSIRIVSGRSSGTDSR